MGTIKVTYDPYEGLVQRAGGRGVRINGTLSYSSATESASVVTTDLTITDESFVAVDASSDNVIVTLPTAESGRKLSVKKIDASSNTVTLQPSNSELIDGGVSAIITTQWTTLTLQAIDSAWYIR